MPVFIKSDEEIKKIREAGRIVAQTLAFIEKMIIPGRSLKELELACADFIRAAGGFPAFLGYRGFPAAVCISINEEVVHGIPDGRILKEGEIVKIDVGVKKDGFYADGAKTFPVGKTSKEVKKLLKVTETALYLGIEKAIENNRVSDISRAIQNYVEKHGFSVVKELSGHAVGLELHEDPTIPNFVSPKGQWENFRLVSGMVLAIEPMVNLGTDKVRTKKNKWTVVTDDNQYSAHFEHTILVRPNKPEILTTVQ